MSTYRLIKHKRIGNTRHMEVEINQGEPPEGRVIEVFNWGIDVSEVDARRETKLLLDAKYASSPPVDLGGTGPF